MAEISVIGVTELEQIPVDVSEMYLIF